MPGKDLQKSYTKAKQCGIQLPSDLSNDGVMNPEKEDKERREVANIGIVLKKLTNLGVGKLTVFIC